MMDFLLQIRIAARVLEVSSCIFFDGAHLPGRGTSISIHLYCKVEAQITSVTN